MKKLILFLISLTIIGCNKENDTALGWDDVFLENYSCGVYFGDQSIYDPKINGTVKAYHLRFNFYYSIEDLQEARLFYLNHRLDFIVDDRNQNLIVEFDSLALDFINAATSQEHHFLFIHKKKRLEFTFKKNKKIEFTINPPIYTYKPSENRIEQLYYDVANGNHQFITNITDILGSNGVVKGTAWIQNFTINDSILLDVQCNIIVSSTLHSNGHFRFPDFEGVLDTMGVVIGSFDFPFLNDFIQKESRDGEIITIIEEKPSFRLPYYFYKF